MPYKMQAGEAVHLGDGAYLFFDGYSFELRANHHENPTDRVYLDRDAIPKLIRHLQETLSQ